jgi:CBS domain-containing protein
VLLVDGEKLTQQGNSGTRMLIGATVEFLRQQAPFDRMAQEDLEFLASHAKQAYFEKDAIVLAPEMGAPRFLHIVQRGRVLRRDASNAGTSNENQITVSPGECFPIGALVAGQSTGYTYSAIDDVFIYLLPVEDFTTLMQRSQVFNLFCTGYLASMFSQSRKQLQAQLAQRTADQQQMSSPLSSIVKRMPVMVTPSTPLRQVLQAMADQRIGSMIVGDSDGRAIGILTQSDVLKRVALPALPLETPVEQVMSTNPHTLPFSAHVQDAALAMASHGIRHVLVVDAEEKVCGLVSERDLFALQRVGMRQIREAIEGAPDLERLIQAGGDVRQLAVNMLAQGVDAEHMTQFISALNDAMTRRVIELNLANHDLFGLEWAWMAFGSEGRDEQTFSTDQDNGIIFLCPEMTDREPLELRFHEFALDVNRDLDRCGFPLCKGNIMASNPEWCMTLENWQERFTNWIRVPEPTALLNATIFFDFRCLFGAKHLTDRLRTHLLEMARGNPNFLRAMATNALTVEAPLGRFRDFVTDLDPKRPGVIDLKTYGSRLFIDVARIYALANGVHNTNTPQRMKLAAARMGVSEEEIEAAIDAFGFIQMLRLRHQHLETERGNAGDNFVNPDSLNELDRRILKESFKQARKYQQRLKLDYQAG